MIPENHTLNTDTNKTVTVYGYGTYDPKFTAKLTYKQFKYIPGSVCDEKYFRSMTTISFDTSAWMCFIRVDSTADVEATDDPRAFGDICKFAFK